MQVLSIGPEDTKLGRFVAVKFLPDDLIVNRVSSGRVNPRITSKHKR
jgi:hypothetical protein